MAQTPNDTFTTHRLAKTTAQRTAEQLFADNPVGRLHEALANSFNPIAPQHIDEGTPAGACLQPLLGALNWTGEARQLAEALPHFDSVQDIHGLRTVLEKLNFDSSPRRTKLCNLTDEMVPCLFELEDGTIHLITDIEDDGQLHIFDGLGKSRMRVSADTTTGIAYVVKPIDRQQQQDATRATGWMASMLHQFKRTFATLLGLSLVVNILALCLPIYIMSVYEHAIGTKSLVTLVSMLCGVAVIVVTELYLRRVRGRALAYLGARIENLIAGRVFQQILYMPVAMTETASMGAQLTRFRQFEGIRDLFSGSLATALLDIPFLIIFVIAVFMIGGPLGFMPLALIGIYLAMAVVTIPKSQALLRQLGSTRAKRKNFLIELVNMHASITDNCAEKVWLDRYRDINGAYLVNQFRSQQYNMRVQTVAQSLVVVAGAATVGVGALMAMDGAISMGALIATTALVWRGLSPLQSVFLGLGQVGQAVESFKQIDHLLRLPQERDPGALPTITRKLEGHVQFNAASLRYNAHAEPALRGVTFEARPGEIVAITGDSGSGKSTILKVILGLYGLQAGSTSIDGLDTRQFDVGELRQSIGYLPQKNALFYGTIAQNLKLADPTATQQDIERALSRVGALEEIRQLPDGVNTRLLGANEHRFSDGLLKQIAVARALLKPTSLYLLDEPASDLDRSGDDHLMATLTELKGQATVLMTTHRPSHMKLADRVVVLRAGSVVASGPPEQIVPMLLGQARPAGQNTSQAAVTL